MLAKRILSLVIGFAFTIFVILYTNIVVINIVVCAFMAIAVYEFGKAMKEKGINTLSDVLYLVILALFAVNVIDYLGMTRIPISDVYIYVFYPLSILAILMVGVVMHNKYNVIDVAATLMQLLYCVFIFSFLINICGLDTGKVVVWYVFLGSWFCDIFAFCFGKAFGKHKLTKLSPNKTIEGSIAGVFGSVLACLAYTYIINTYLQMDISYLAILVFGLIASIFSQFGDLFASSIKRYTGIKDFGNIFPGHGGIMDRFDSTIFVIPLVYFFALFIF